MNAFIEVRARKAGGWIVGVRYGTPESAGVYYWQKGCDTVQAVRVVLERAAQLRRYVVAGNPRRTVKL